MTGMKQVLYKTARNVFGTHETIAALKLGQILTRLHLG